MYGWLGYELQLNFYRGWANVRSSPSWIRAAIQDGVCGKHIARSLPIHNREWAFIKPARGKETGRGSRAETSGVAGCFANDLLSAWSISN